MASFADIWDDLQDVAKSIPAAERLFQKRTKEEQFDISTSKLFSEKPVDATHLVAAVR